MGNVLNFLWIWFSPYLTSPVTWGVFVFGLCIGSFMNVCIVRIPEETFWKHTRSVCPKCGAGIPFYLNIPLLSYLWLRGRAACCGTRISVQYPLVELGTAVLLVLLYWHYPFLNLDFTPWKLDGPNLIRFLHAALFSCILIV